MSSLRGRVLVASIGVLTLGLVVLSVAINLLLANRLSADASSVLRERVSAHLATIHISGGRIHLSEAPGDAALDAQSWIFSNGRLVERAPAPADVQRAVRALAAVRQPTERTIGSRLRLRAEPANDLSGKQVGTIVVGLSLAPYRDTERIALIGTLALSLFVLLVGLIAVRRAIDAALRPVGDMTRRASEWSERDLHRRFEMGPARDELTGLAATFDALLGRIEGVLRHEQRLSAELAHELRTPLAGMRAEAELALRSQSSGPELRTSLERVVAATDRMAAVIETLLTSARAEHGAPPGSCAPFPAIEEVVDSLRPAAAAHAISIAVLDRAPGTTVEAGPEVVAQAVHPLLDNAIRHAASQVAVTIDRSDGVVAIRVDDDGAGVTPADASNLFSPGASTAGGAGLGLPLARRLARSCGGEVIAVANAPGGRFELRLPVRSG
jgi:two-component system OmpR family sensor kinase